LPWGGAEDNVDDCERRGEDEEDRGVKDSDGDEEEIESMMGMYVKCLANCTSL